MYTKKTVLLAIDEYLISEGSVEYYLLDLNTDNIKEYYNVKLSELNLLDNNLIKLVSYLEDELSVPMKAKGCWKTINDVCNAFKWLIKNRKEIA